MHVMFRAQPRTELSKFINAYKSASSRHYSRSDPSIHWNPGREKVLNIAYRFRIYPTEEQKILLGKTFGYCRFLYNQMLDDKIREYEKTKKMIKVDRFFPSSKKCCKCGRIKKELRLFERVYHCECRNKMDRDHNAAISIREEARRMLIA